jgi:hypothetical protein
MVEMTIKDSPLCSSPPGSGGDNLKRKAGMCRKLWVAPAPRFARIIFGGQEFLPPFDGGRSGRGPCGFFLGLQRLPHLQRRQWKILDSHSDGS